MAGQTPETGKPKQRDKTTNLLASLGWTDQELARFEAASNQSKSEVNILVAGVTGSGKSSLINALCGACVIEGGVFGQSLPSPSLPAREGHSLQHETPQVKGYEAQLMTCEVAQLKDRHDQCGATGSESGTARKFTVIVWDSPGLEDGTGKQRSYVMQMQEKCGSDIDMLLYCVDMATIRYIDGNLERQIALITDVLGVNVWKHSMIVLTFANVVERRIDKEMGKKSHSTPGEDGLHVFLSRVDHWKKNVQIALQHARVPSKIARAVPIEPAGHYSSPHLPDRIHWLGYLWLLFLRHARDEAKLAILLNNQDRIKNVEYLTPTNMEELINGSQPLIFINEERVKAIVIGSVVTMGVVSGVGACVGGVTGAVVVGGLTAGVGTGVGLVAGAAAGVVLGPLFSIVVNKALQKMKDSKSMQDGHKE